jgi:Transposase DDE domain
MAPTFRIATTALLMATPFAAFPFLLKLYADGGYQGAEFQAAVKRTMAQVNVEIVKRSDGVRGFGVLPKRWLVERSFAWLNRCRRLAKDWECLSRKRGQTRQFYIGRQSVLRKLLANLARTNFCGTFRLSLTEARQCGRL